MKKIILISGKAEAGKDSAAQYWQKKLSKTCVLHFSDYLKYICKEYFGWNGEKDVVGRTILQYVGTDLVRVKYNKPTYWVERVCDVVEFASEQYDYFIVPDCRFPDEIFTTLSRFGNENVLSIRVERNGHENKLTPDQRKHESETVLDNFKYFSYHAFSYPGLETLYKSLDDIAVMAGLEYEEDKSTAELQYRIHMNEELSKKAPQSTDWDIKHQAPLKIYEDL